MAKSTKTAKKVSEINDISKDLFTENVTQNPVVITGEKVKVKVKSLICASYGTFYAGSETELEEKTAQGLAAIGCVEILANVSSGSGE